MVPEAGGLGLVLSARIGIPRGSLRASTQEPPLGRGGSPERVRDGES